MDNRFVKTSTIGSWCLSSIQVSSDNFSSCIKTSSDPTTDDNKTFSFTPSSNLDNDSNYKIKVTTAAVEYCNCTPLSNEYFTPVKKRTSIGRSPRSKPKNKNKRRQYVKYRGQG